MAIATVRACAKSLAREYRDDPRTLVAEGLRLARRGEEQLAFELFRAAPRAVTTMAPEQIESLLPSLHDWNSTDCFGSFVSGVAWREGALTDRHILAWTRSHNLWIRRAALVSTVPLNLRARGATSPTGEARKTLAVCTELVADRDDMIVKALSWALRTLASQNSPPVRAFIQKHRDRLAARVIRETTNKLNTGLKNPGMVTRIRPPQPATNVANKARRGRTKRAS